MAAGGRGRSFLPEGPRGRLRAKVTGNALSRRDLPRGSDICCMFVWHGSGLLRQRALHRFTIP